MKTKCILMCSVMARGFNKSRKELIDTFLNLNYEVILVSPDPSGMIGLQFIGKRVKYFQISLERTGINPISDLLVIKELRMIIKNEQPQILYSFGGAKAVIYTTIAGFRESVPNNFCMVNGLGSFFYGKGLRVRIIRQIMTKLFKYALSKSSGVLFQNSDDLNAFVELKIVDFKKCRIVNGSGVNLKSFPFTKINSFRTFLFVGRLLRDKGIYEFIEAARLVKKTYPDAVFFVVGGFDTNPNAVKETELVQWVNEGIIKYFGKQEQMLSFYQKCSVFVLPSYHEGTPRTNLEAMAVGRPVITTDAPGCRETVLEGKTGYMVPVMNVDILAERMKQFLDHPDLIVEMGKKGNAYVVKKYDVRKVNQSIMNFILNNE